jgi:hypothetical protein
MTISAHAWANNGWSKSTISSTERLTKDEWENYTVDDQFIISTNAFHDYVWYKFLHLEKPFYDHNKKNIFIIGDSMAGDFTNIMIDSKLYNEKKMEVRTQPIRHNCKSLIKISEKTTFPNRIDSEKCFKQYSNIANSINLKNADIIVLASVWEKWTIDSLKETINYLRNNYDASLVILGNKKISEEGLTAYKKKHKKVKITDDTILINDVISEFITPTTVFIRLTDYFCHDNECPLTTDEDFLFFYDNTHLTPKGIKTVGYNLSEKGKEFRNVIEGHLK